MRCVQSGVQAQCVSGGRVALTYDCTRAMRAGTVQVQIPRESFANDAPDREPGLPLAASNMSSNQERNMSETKVRGDQKPADMEHPQPVVHSDNEKSKLPERDDEGRNQSPADRPGKKPGEGEPSVS
jgi:hypothetical protein